MNEQTLIPLPAHVTEPFDVFINGVPQTRDHDFEVQERVLVFPRALEQERQLSLLRRLFLVLAGNYRKHESVDVAYERHGRRVVATGLEPQPIRHE